MKTELPLLVVTWHCDCGIFFLWMSRDRLIFDPCSPSYHRPVVTYMALFAVQNPSWGIHFFALLVLAFLLQVFPGGNIKGVPLLQPERLGETVPTITNTSNEESKCPSHQSKCWNLQQDSACLVVFPSHGIVVHDRLFAEVHNLKNTIKWYLNTYTVFSGL